MMSKFELIPKDACPEVVEWAEQYDTLQDAWNACTRVDWMLWLLARIGGDRQRLVFAACECARLALQYVPLDEVRPLRAIETAERWARGEASLAEVETAREAAWEATKTAMAAVHAAWAVAAMDVTVWAAADEVAWAAWDAAKTAEATAAQTAQEAAKVAAETAVLAQCADIVRGYFPKIVAI